MERLFSPCTRLHDLIYYDPFPELNLNVSTEEFLSAERAFTFADLYAMLGNEDTVAWLTPHAAVIREDGLAMGALEHLDEWCRFCFTVDGKYISAYALSPEHLLEICNVVLRLLAVSEVHRVSLEGASIDAPSLAYLMEQCQSLQFLLLEGLNLDEDQCRVLGAYSRPDLEIVLDNCAISDAGASALAEVLGRNQGPTKLDGCRIDNFVLANGLRGNSRLKSWGPRISRNPDVGNREVLAIAGALQENKGLVDLDLSNGRIRVNDVTWGAICDSLKAHPTLEVLNLRGVFTVTGAPLLKSQIKKLVDMMKVNMTIHTIHTNPRYIYESFRRSVIPYLETNRFRPHLLAIQRTRPQTYRAKVLGRALLAVRTDPNRFWMLLLGNAEVAFPSTTAAESLPTPANATATESVAPVGATATVSAAGQKRKACP
jgi:hypothetical protein